MSKNYEKLILLLKELFQFDRADLDFGIFRIMNQKRDEISAFLEKDLLPQVKEAFSEYKSADAAGFEDELNQTIKNVKEAGFDPDQSPKVTELREKISLFGVDVEALENEVYSHLYNFFRRYYHEGDFLSLRRYKEGVYAIPYEGEEVKLYWANHDQYYIKSSEYLRDYAFKLFSGKIVHFKLTDADVEKDNIKAQNGKEKRFIIVSENPVEEIKGELFIRFEYMPDAEKRKQADLNKQAAEKVLKQKGFDQWVNELSDLMPTEKNKERTLLEKHLTDYTARNTFDYFIHKDLGGFLRRELDFYIKNEVMHLDDIENETVPRVEQYLSRIKVLRKTAGKIIAFLAQLENFQKKLWLKKKFVVETNYCVTLDRVPEELYEEIVSNDAQREEWVRLFAIDEIEKDLVTEGYAEPLSLRFFKENKFLVVDTKYFGEDFKKKLLGSFEDLDRECDGLLIHGENFQALSLLKEKYREKVKCIYIDPPYNTGDDGFVYKDNYKSSSWLSMLGQTTSNIQFFLEETSSYFISCDENEALDLGQLLINFFGSKNHVETITWNKRVPKNDKGIGNIHEYIYLFTKNLSLRRSLEMTFVMRKDGLEEIYEQIRKAKQRKLPIEETKKKLKNFYKKQGYDRGITLYCEIDPNYDLWGKINMAWPNPKSEGPRYEVINPVTNKPTPIPKKGWRWTEETFKKAELDGHEYILPGGSMMKGKIWYSADENTQPSSITYLRDVESFLLRSIISLKSDGSLQLEHFGLGGLINYPKPSRLMEWLFYSTKETSGCFMDFFAGSGTSAQALINLNKDDGGDRKYILIEMGHYFDTVLKPRVQKVVYSENWKNGKPISREGFSHMFKYIRLESYEDTLNNLELKRTGKQMKLLLGDAMSKKAREEYMLSYMLDVESRGSLLNINLFENPFNYMLNISTGSVGETKPTTVDLVETFNYLIGLTIKHIDYIQGFCVVEGTNPKEEKVLVIWRNTKEKSNKALETFFRKQDYSTRDMEFDLIYVNGDNNLENIRRSDETWKVRLIEEEFKRLMFDVEDV